MQITINDRVHELKFGLKFIQNLNEAHGIMTDMGNIGGGINRTLPGLLNADVEAIMLIIKCSTKGLSEKQIEDYLASVSDEGVEAFDKLVEDLLDAIKEGTFTKVPFAKAMKAVEESKKKE